LIEAGYGIMNEYQVAIGESTCAAKFWAAPTSAGGKAQIEARELSRLVGYFWELLELHLLCFLFFYLTN